MRKFWWAALALVVLRAGTAAAADLPPAYKAPVALTSAPINSWTGLYVGLGYGYGMWNAGTTAIDAATTAPLTTDFTNGGRGWLGMVTVGYDYQFGEHIVAGVFGEWDPSSIKGTLATGMATAPFNVLSGTEKESSSWYVGGRIGWLVTPTLLTYWTGGYTEARFDGVSINNSVASLGFPASTQSNAYHGWFLGGGMETQLTFLPIRGLFVRSEYDYASYNNATSPIINGTTGGAAFLVGTPIALRVSPIVQTVMTGVTYKFNWTP
jgi:outer membrane immunogenic protein